MQNLQSKEAVKVLKTGISILTRRVWVGKILHNIRMKIQWRRSAVPKASELKNLVVNFDQENHERRMMLKYQPPTLFFILSKITVSSTKFYKLISSSHEKWDLLDDGTFNTHVYDSEVYYFYAYPELYITNKFADC